MALAVADSDVMVDLRRQAQWGARLVSVRSTNGEQGITDQA